MARVRFAFFGCALAAACGNDLPHTAPFDPDTPLEKQARTSVSAQVSLEGEGDAAQVTFELQNAVRTYSGTSRSDGTVSLTGVVPGVYEARLSTRYFVEYTERITVTLGEPFDLGLHRLKLKRAAVLGKASYDRGGAAGSAGGVLVTLLREAGVRPAAYAGAAVTDDPTLAYAALSGSDGSYRLDEVPAGTYAVEAQGSDGAGYPVGEVTITGDEAEVTADPIVFKIVSGFFEIEGTSNGAPSQVYSQVTDVTLKLSGFNAVKMRIGESPTQAAVGCAFTGGDRTFVALKTHALPHEGDNHVCVVFIGEDGAATAPLVESIHLDSLPPTGGALFLDDGRSTTTSPLVTATLAAGGADQMYLGQTGCEAGSAWQDYAPVANLNLGAGNGLKTVYVTYRDLAGNRSACLAASITLDSALDAPGWNVLIGGPGIAGTRTSRQLVTLSLTALTADVVEMRVANDASFAGTAWSSVQGSLPWLLTPGDGPKTVYVKLRDSAGNESTALPVAITLDQTGPEVPGFAVQDVDGDGYALSATTIELRWNTPAAGDLAGFEVQRFVQGVSPAFAHLATLATNATAYVDGVTATTGRPHYYQIRAFDDLGNASSWSVAAHTIPFEGPDSITWVNTEDGLRFFFPVRSGTNNLSPSYFYSDLAGADYVGGLASNVTEWLRPAASNNYWDENIVARTSNQDNSLIYESTFPLQLSSRETVDHDPGGSYLGYGQGIATDKQGHVYLSYFDGGWGYLYMATNKSGNWVRETVDDSYVVNSASQIMLDANGKVHIVYMANSGIEYANNVTGQWTHLPLVAGNVRSLSAAMGPDGTIHVVYVVLFSIGVAPWADTNTLYGTVVSGVWSGSTIQNNSGYHNESPAIAVANDGTVHVAYYHGTNGDLMYASKLPAGGFTVTALDTAGTAGLAPSIDLDASGRPQIAYQTNTYDVRWIKKTMSGWASYQTVATAATTNNGDTGIAVTPENETFIFYVNSSNRFYMLRNTGTAWLTSQIDSNIDYTYGQSMRVTRDRSRIHIVCMEIYERNVRHISVYPGGLLKDVLNPSPANSLAMGDLSVAANGTAQFLYFNYWDWNLYYAANTSGTWAKWVFEANAQWPRMRVDSAGNPKVVYANGNPKYAYKNGSGPWIKEVIDASVSVAGANDLVLRSGNIPVVSYATTGKAVRFADRSTGTWSVETVDPVATNRDTSVAVLPNGNPVLAYTDADLRLKIVERIGGIWTAQPFAPPITTTGYAQDLTVDSDGSIHIAYQESVAADMWYATNRGGSWTYTLIDTLGDSGYRPHIYVDHGTVHLFFLGGSNRFMYATDAGGWHTNVFVTLGYSGNFGGADVDPSGNLHAMHSWSGQWYYRPFIGGRLAPSTRRRIPAW